MLIYTSTNELSPQMWIWKIEEEAQFFIDALAPLGFNHDIYPNFKRKIEVLASRYLMLQILGVEIFSTLIVDEFGKLHTSEKELFISISHSFPYTTIVKHHAPVGIDIQCYSDKLLTIQNRFLSDLELQYFLPENPNYDDIPALSLLWNIKEAVYKAHGKKEIIFKNQIIIQKTKPILEAQLLLENETKTFHIISQIYDEFSYAIAYVSDTVFCSAF